MKAVKTLQKYKCDFCKRRSVKSAMERHEKVCWRNPNRICPLCENNPKGVKVMDGREYGGSDYYEACHYCSQRDPEKEKSIDQFYTSQQPTKDRATEDKVELPF